MSEEPQAGTTAAPANAATTQNSVDEAMAIIRLLSEDIDPASGELWGNYPQTYSLVGLINCAVLLSKPWSAVR